MLQLDDTYTIARKTPDLFIVKKYYRDQWQSCTAELSFTRYQFIAMLTSPSEETSMIQRLKSEIISRIKT